MKKRLFLLLFVAGCGAASANTTDEATDSGCKSSDDCPKTHGCSNGICRDRELLRFEYIEKAIDKLKAFKPSGNERFHIKKLEERERIYDRDHCKYLHYRKFITVGDNGWIYVLVHSFHEEEDDVIIGDLNMAIDHEGNLYINKAHLCSGPAFCSPSPDGLPTMEYFFRSGLYGRRDRWERYYPKPIENGKPANGIKGDNNEINRARHAS